MKYVIILALAMPVTGQCQTFGWSNNPDPYGFKARAMEDRAIEQNYMQQEQLRLLRQQNEMMMEQQMRNKYNPFNPYGQ